MTGICVSLIVFRFFAPWAMGQSADEWFTDEDKLQQSLADYLVEFEANDDKSRSKNQGNRFVGEWVLVTHQMIPRLEGDVDDPTGGVRFVIPERGNYKNPGVIPHVGKKN